MLLRWFITDKGDPAARRLVDGETTNGRPHYSRQTPGALQFTRNGQNLVFITEDLLAVWVTFRPTPGVATRPDKLDGWECALFRNEGPEKSSSLIREAVMLSWALWGRPGKDGLFTYVKPECVGQGREDHVVGYCYRRAGWRRVGYDSKGKPRFKAPAPHVLPNPSLWQWKQDRNGKLRRELEPLIEVIS